MKLVPAVEKKKKRQPGLMKGKIWYADDWDSPETNKMIEDMFYDGALDSEENTD